MKLDQDYRLRDALPADYALIIHSWVLNMGRCLHSTYAHDYPPRQRARIKKLFDRKSVRIRVACAMDDVDEIFGFIVGEPVDRVVHFIYVKAPYQKWGIGSVMYKVMFGDAVVTCTQFSRDLSEMRKAKKLPEALIYNPYWFEEQ